MGMGRVNLFMRVSRARARAAPSASGFDPAAPARSYRVGSGTTRSKPLAEGTYEKAMMIFDAYEGKLYGRSGVVS